MGLGSVAFAPSTSAGDIESVQQRGVLRHLAIPYSRFVTRSGDGLDVELVQRFAAHLGVKYQLVECPADEFFGRLTGAAPQDGTATPTPEPLGDLGACGVSITPDRTLIVDFSVPTFPTQVWLVARAESAICPIVATGNLATDIESVKRLLPGVLVLCKPGSSLDARLYGVVQDGARVVDFTGTINDLIPAVIHGDAETTLMDIPAAADALAAWVGRIKVIGPISQTQHMAIAFAKTSPRLREEFNLFFARCKADGTYMRLVRKYFPGVIERQREFFRDCRDETQPGSGN
ncbi:MAG: hypothetical protein A3K19_32385 [Lentisphaerae bacterium RIFOXYB12_FULL_65_16]|nr:MAG: hypothetical protein A3K18_11890 [Lentisphaerae bacterium RIFOXYA12_64_32]OGV85727.1 MAG: hypothetical protein A3K19_32385 [Lentisphaerae bacterium RIFOXYB12_FULL_65_16]